MNKFDIRNFINSVESDSLENTEVPNWLLTSTDKVKAIYKQVIDDADFIEKQILSADKLKANDRKIVISRIANKVGVDKSYITKRRTPQIISLINRKNDRLKRLWNANKRINSNKSKTKEALNKEVSSLKKLLIIEKDKNYSEAISKALNSTVSERQEELASQVADLRIKNAEYMAANARLRGMLKGKL